MHGWLSDCAWCLGRLPLAALADGLVQWCWPQPPHRLQASSPVKRSPPRALPPPCICRLVCRCVRAPALALASVCCSWPVLLASVCTSVACSPWLHQERVKVCGSYSPHEQQSLTVTLRSFDWTHCLYGGAWKCQSERSFRVRPSRSWLSAQSPFCRAYSTLG